MDKLIKGKANKINSDKNKTKDKIYGKVYLSKGYFNTSRFAFYVNSLL